MFSWLRRSSRIIWAVDEAGRTELHRAALQGDYKTLMRLFKDGAGEILHATDKQGNTALHCVAHGVDGIPEQYERGEKDPTWYQKKAKDYEKTLSLLLQQPVYLNAPNNAGETPLHLAVRISRQIPLMDALIKAGAAIDALDNSGNSVLHLAVSVRKETFHVLQYLLRNPRMQRVLNHKNQYEQAPLHLVVAKEPYPDQGLVFNALMVAGVSVDVANVEGETSLHFAAWRGDRDMMQALLARTNQLHAQDLEGNTPLHKAFKAAEKESYDLVVIELLLKAGANPDSRNFTLQTPRMLAQDIPRLRSLLAGYPEVKPAYSLNQQETLTQTMTDILQRQSHLVRLFSELQDIELTAPFKQEVMSLAVKYQTWFPKQWPIANQEPLDITALQKDRDNVRFALVNILQKVQTLDEQLRQHRSLWELAQESTLGESDQFLTDKIQHLESELKIYKRLQDFYQVLLAQWPYLLQKRYLQTQWQEIFHEKAEEEYHQRAKVQKVIIDEPTDSLNTALAVHPVRQNLEERPVFSLLKDRLKRFKSLRPKRESLIMADSVQVLLEDWYIPKSQIANQIPDNNNLSNQDTDTPNINEILETEETRSHLLLSEQNQLKQEIAELQQQLTVQQQNQVQVTLMQAQLAEMQAQQQLLWSEYNLKKDYKESVERFRDHPNLFLYYRAIQIKLEEIFIGFKTVASGLVDPTAGQLATVKSVAEMLGDVIAIVPIIGPVIEKFGKWGFGKVIDTIDQTREKNRAIDVSELVTLSEVKKTAERTARELTLRYEEQLKRLATPEQEARMCSKLQKGLEKTKAAIIRSKALPAAKQMAAYAILVMLEALQSGAIREDKPMDEQLVATVTKINTRIESIWSSLFNPLQLIPLKTVQQIDWQVTDVYYKPGIKVATDTAHTYYQGKGAEPDRYGWRLGSHEEAKVLNWQPAEAPKASTNLQTLFQQPTNSNVNSSASPNTTPPTFRK